MLIRDPTIAEVDLNALIHNLRHIRKYLGPGCATLGVVKADAYGHGATEVSRALIREGIAMLGVGRLSEGIKLREAGISAPILLMGGTVAEAGEAVIHYELTPVIYELSAAVELDRVARAMGRIVRVHVKIETGMARLGFGLADAKKAMHKIMQSKGIVVEGIMTHLADADKDQEFTREQLRRFHRAVKDLRDLGLRVPLVHAANSAGILFGRKAHFDMVRPGIMLYGYPPSPRIAGKLELKPVLSWKTQIIQVRSLPRGATISYGRTFTAKRKSRIAVLPVGYADGMGRVLSNNGWVLIGSKRAPIVGRVCMDLTMVDITDHPSGNVGDEVVLIGQQGSEAVQAQTLADLMGTIPYEVLCMISHRIPRIHIGGPIRVN